MRKLLPLMLLLPVLALSQPECESHFAAGVSYVLPKGVSAEGSYFVNRFNAGIGVAYNLASGTKVKNGVNEYELPGNSLDIFAYAGYKVVQVDYVVSAFLNAGYTMGNVEGLQPFVSSKILFPAGQKAFSVEPFYIFSRGLSARATLYLRL